MVYPLMGISDIVLSPKDPKMFGFIGMNQTTGTPYFYMFQLNKKTYSVSLLCACVSVHVCVHACTCLCTVSARV